MTSGASTAIAQTDSSSTAAAQEEAGDVEAITITGIRRSLRSSADFKRGKTAVVDSISSEDLGKFPDTNVAESLQRITGLAITRTRGGEGQFVTVRGLGEEFNAVTYNGRLLATENNGREFSFDVIASELIAGAEVYKSPTASQGDGSLGGRINLRPSMPLDNPGIRMAASVSGQYESLAETVGPRASGVASFTTWGDKIGILGSFSYQRREARSDVAESTFLVNDIQVDENGVAGATIDQDGDGMNDTTGARILTNDGRFNGFATSLVEQERERIGGTAAIQFRPVKNFTLTVDGLYTAFRAPSTQFSYSYFPTLADASRTSAMAVLNNANQIVSHVTTPFATDFVVRENEADTETFAVGANADWRINDKASFKLDLAFSRSDGQRDNLGSASGSGGFFVIGYPDGAFSQSFTGRPVPDVNFTAANTPMGQQVQFSQLDPADARLHFSRNDFVRVEDEILSARGDFDLRFAEGWKGSLG
ncbi:MAG: TonB-dependent receptor plug domain-containing protein, partial [Myxococcota bacterium]